MKKNLAFPFNMCIHLTIITIFSYRINVSLSKNWRLKIVSKIRSDCWTYTKLTCLFHIPTLNIL